MMNESTTVDDVTIASGHRLVLHAGSIALAVMVVLGASPLGNVVFGR